MSDVQIIQPTNPDNNLTPAVPINQPELAPVVTPPPPKRRGWLKLVIVIVTVVLLAIAGRYGYQYYQSHHKKTDTAATAKQDIAKFTYGVVAGPLNSYYPDNAVTVDVSTLNEQTFEGLVVYRDKKIVPNLAVSWTNPDESTWLFKLKPNVKFHTGNTMTAADVKYSLDQVKGTDTGALFASTIKSVEVVDATTVKIKTDGPDPILLNKLVFLYVIDSQSTVKDSPLNGTGPFTLKPGTTPSADAVDLVAFDQYHGGHVYMRELDFRVFGDDAATATALKNGSLNLASFSDVTESDKIKNQYVPFYMEDPTVFGLILNVNKTGPLQNLKVRQALYDAIDPVAFLKNINTPGTVASQVVVKDIPGYDPAITRPAYNVTEAKQLLKEAGYPNGITINVTYPQGIDLLQKSATELTSQLKLAGITLQANALSHAQLATVPVSSVDTRVSGAYSDLLDLSDVYGSIVGDYYSNPTIAAVMNQANTTTDPTARLKLLQTVSSQLMTDLPFIPLYNGVAPYLLSSNRYHMSIDIPATAYPGVYFWQTYQ